MLIKDSIFRN